MKAVDNLLKLAEDNGITVDFRHVSKNTSLSVRLQDKCFIAMDISLLFDWVKGCENLAHELGHCETGSFYCVHAAADVRGRHEYKADKWATHYLLPPDKLRQAVKEGYTEPWELAERLGVTEDFLRRAVYIYQCEGLIE